MIFTKKKKQAVDSIKADENGKYSFRGPYYEFVGDDAEYRTFRLRMILLSSAIPLVWLGGGLVPAPGMMNCFYVLIPYFILMLCSGAYALWAAVRLISAGKRVRDYVYSSTVASIPTRCVVATVMASLSAICDIVYLILNGMEGKTLFAALKIAAVLAIGTLILLLRKTVTDSSWKKISVSHIRD